MRYNLDFVDRLLRMRLLTKAQVLYPSPGYPIYESMIKFLGGVAVPYSYMYEMCQYSD